MPHQPEWEAYRPASRTAAVRLPVTRRPMKRGGPWLPYRVVAVKETQAAQPAAASLQPPPPLLGKRRHRSAPSPSRSIEEPAGSTSALPGWSTPAPSSPIRYSSLKSPPRRSTGVCCRPATHRCRRPCWTEDENEDAAGAFARRLGTCRWAPLAHRRCLGRLRACSSPRCYCRGVRERARTAAAAPSAAVGASVASRCCKPWEGSLPMA